MGQRGSSVVVTFVAVGLAASSCTIVAPIALGTTTASHNRDVDREHRHAQARHEAALASCRARRDSLHTEAMATSDRQARSALIGAMPDCKETVPGVAPPDRQSVAGRVFVALVIGAAVDFGLGVLLVNDSDALSR